jgi:hypothetical protein
MSFWNYRGRCIGRVIHFLYHYAGMDVAEHATIGGDSVEYRGKSFAEYTWSDRFGEADVPVFSFLSDGADRLDASQTVRRAEAISDACASDVPEDGRAVVGAAVIAALARVAYDRANIAFQVFHGTDPKYFVRGDRLFAEANGWVYAWLPEAKNWMLWVEGDRSGSVVALGATANEEKR